MGDEPAAAPRDGRGGEDGEPDAGPLFYAFFSALLFAGLWLRPMFSSLWLDELGTWWVIKDSFSDTLDRALEYHGQSPAFYVIAWAAKTIGGAREQILRLPSLAAMSGAVFVTYRLARRLFDSETGRLTIVTFAASGSLAFAASEARPYAIGILVLVGSTLTLVVWLDDARHRWGLLYVALAVATLWLNYVFGLALVGHAVYAIVQMRRGDSTLSWRGIMIAWVSVLLLLTPLVSQLSSLWSRREALSVPYDPVPLDLLVAVVPAFLGGAFLLGALLARSQGPFHVEPGPQQNGAWALLVPWVVVPPGVLLALTAWADVQVASSRYYLSAAPATAILLAWGLRAIRPVGARRIMVAMLAITSVMVSGGALKAGEDWAGAAAFVRASSSEETPLLLHPAFVESRDLRWFEDPERVSYLTSPIAFYPMPGEIELVPYVLDDDAKRYMARLLDDVSSQTDRFVFVTRYPHVPWREWMDGRLGVRGWRSDEIGRFGDVRVVAFTRPDVGG